MRYYFDLKESQEGIKTLVVAREDGYSYLLGNCTINIVNVVTGERAQNLYDELLARATKENKTPSNWTSPYPEGTH